VVVESELSQGAPPLEETWMGGLVLDILIEYIVRIIIRLFKARGAESWPVIKAKVTGTNYR
jgi:hypothetical protein